AIIPLVDVVEESAAAIESINTVVNDDGVLTASNTDYEAVASLLASHAVDPTSSVLLRGSGGMAKAVTAAFRGAGFERLTVVARNEQTGPDAPTPYFGPVNNANQLAHVQSFVDTLPDHASIALGGSRVGDRGYFHQATIVSGLRQDDRAVQQEIFGPVQTVRTMARIVESTEDHGLERIARGEVREARPEPDRRR
ncbi:aldehyde dehydrogenase family protein, partial [Bacillus sp. S34]|nr:aldehyde dehydrogenase family protein [Bacillus sp. S34]